MQTKIMVVDDSKMIHMEMSYLLTNTSYEIVSFCRSGEEGIASFELCRPDIVTLDIVMPGMDGLQTAQLMLEKWPQTKIVVISSLAYDDILEKAKEIGVVDFIYKPFEREQVLEVLDRVAHTL